jgi:hypothetical protein
MYRNDKDQAYSTSVPDVFKDTVTRDCHGKDQRHMLRDRQSARLPAQLAGGMGTKELK